MKQQLFCVVEGTTYKTMPLLVPPDNGCLGCCCATTQGYQSNPGLCIRLTAEYDRVFTEDSEWDCADVVWVPDTPEGLAGYVAAKLES